MEDSSLDVVRGTLDVLILKTLSWGAMHGYAVSRSILRQTDEGLLVEEGALLPSPQSNGMPKVGSNQNGVCRKTPPGQILSLTPDGRRRLREEVKTWTHYAEAVGKVLGATTSHMGET